MARITTYELDSNISLNDKLVGTDADDNSITKNYSIDALGDGLISLKNIITGTGTLNTIPMFTPDGATIGDSIMFTKSNGTEIQVGVHPSLTQTTLGAGFVSTYAVGAEVVTATNINAGALGTLTASGNIILGDSTADTTTINSTLVINSIVRDSNQSLGTDGQILVANAASELIWSSINVVSEIKTAQATVTDAQIRTLGTVPVEILPGVSGYIYEILGVTTTSINSGGLGDSYDWSASGDGVIYGRGFLPTEHRVEVPNANLPGGGPLVNDSYVATPIAGSFRHGSGVKVSTTLGADPTIPIGQTPVAQWVINITYRIIELA